VAYTVKVPAPSPKGAPSRRFQDVPPITRQRAEQAFGSNDSTRVCDALVRAVFHDPDRRWAQRQCLRLARHSLPEVRGLAATCLGHIARIHRAINRKSAERALKALLKDPASAGRAEDALEDIRKFAG